MRRRRLGAFSNAPQQARELEPLEQGAEARGVRRAQHELVERQGQLDVASDRREFLRQVERAQRLAQPLADLAADFAGPRFQGFDVMELLQPLGRRLRADAGDAGDVVDGVADERQIVRDLLRCNAELLLDAGAVEPRVVHRVDERDVTVDELREILVARRDDRRRAGRRCGPGQCADDVVGLDAFDAQQRNAHRFDRFEQRRHLRAQLVGHRWPVGLVLGVQLVAEGLARRVEDDGHARRLQLVEQLVEHVDDAEHGAGWLPAGRRQRRQRVKGAVQIRRAVDENERTSAHPRPRRRSARARPPAPACRGARWGERHPAGRAALAGRNRRPQRSVTRGLQLGREPS